MKLRDAEHGEGVLDTDEKAQIQWRVKLSTHCRSLMGAQSRHHVSSHSGGGQHPLCPPHLPNWWNLFGETSSKDKSGSKKKNVILI